MRRATKRLPAPLASHAHANPAALRMALEQNDFDCTQMALNAGLARMADTSAGMKATPAGPDSFEKLALLVAVRKHMGVIAMKVFGQEQLIGAAPVDKLLAYALSLPISLASVGHASTRTYRAQCRFSACFYTHVHPATPTTIRIHRVESKAGYAAFFLKTTGISIACLSAHSLFLFSYRSTAWMIYMLAPQPSKAHNRINWE